MTLTKEDFDHIADGDWLHVEFPNGSQVSGVVARPTISLAILVEECDRVYVIDTRGGVHACRIIAHRPVKRAPKVGDVIERDEWDRYDWPEGWTWLHTYPALGGGAYGRSIDGETPCYFAGDVILNWPVTVVQLPAPASDPAPRILHTVEEVEALPVGSIIVDKFEEIGKRRSCGDSRGDWWVDGKRRYTDQFISPVTVLREGEAAS